MRSKNQQLLAEIKNYVEAEWQRSNQPTIDEIADAVGCSFSTAQRYLAYLEETNAITKTKFGYRSNKSDPTVAVGIVGSIPCGPLSLQEEYVEGYIKLPESFIGKGVFFLLRTFGNSMIDAGINEGDMVLVRQQSIANSGDIVVALVDNEVTLKKYFPEPENKRVRLHPENKAMNDIYVSDCSIQGVAIKVFKDLTNNI